MIGVAQVTERLDEFATLNTQRAYAAERARRALVEMGAKTENRKVGGVWSTFSGRWEVYGPEAWPWGDVLRVHTIGDYSIVEYLDCVAVNEEPRARRVRFASFWQGSSRRDRRAGGGRTLDEALLAVICFRAEYEARGINAALNTRAPSLIKRMLWPWS